MLNKEPEKINPNNNSLGINFKNSEYIPKPLLGFIFDDLYTKLYGESPPVVNSLQPSEISDSLELLKDSKTRFTLGKQGKDWITKYHSPKIYLQKLTTIYELVIDGKNIDDIRYELEKIHY